MVSYNNPEEEEKKSPPKASVSKIAPHVTVEKICQTLVECIEDAARGNIDFMEFLQDAAMNLPESSGQADGANDEKGKSQAPFTAKRVILQGNGFLPELIGEFNNRDIPVTILNTQADDPDWQENLRNELR